MIRIHASCVDLGGVGILIRGPSGAGKSDLALRLIHSGARLVADDQVFLKADNGTLFACPAHVLRGKLEVRGVGIIEVPHRTVTAIGCIIDLIDARQMERMPEPVEVDLAGVRIGCHRLDPFEAAVPQKVAAIARFCHNPLKATLPNPIDR